MSEARSPAPSRAVLPLRWGLIVGFSWAYLVVAIVDALFIRVVYVEAFDTDGPSMEPTLLDGDRFVVEKSAYGLSLPFSHEQTAHWADPVPGDVVVLRSPADELEIVKRVIGVAGDRIAIRGDAVYRNGTPLAVDPPSPCRLEDGEESLCTVEAIGDRRWTTALGLPSMPEDMPEVLVGPGTVFVMGDHRDHSNDSRNPRIGLVPVGRVRGRVLAVYYSEAPGRTGTWVR